MSFDTVAGTTVWRLRVANVWVVTARGKIYCSNIVAVATLGLCLLTQLMAQKWRLRVENVLLVNESGICYCSNILPVATLGLCPLTQLLAQQCGVRDWPMFGW